MRIYQDFPEAINEIRRELKEMGIKIHTKSVQNLDITNNPDYDSLELQNYQYTVSSPEFLSIPLKVPAWAEAEFVERTSGKRLNPGKAWEFRQEYWEKFLVPDVNSFGCKVFDYAYPDRMAQPLEQAIKALRQDLSTRRAFIPVFDRQIDLTSEFKHRIPCTLGYWLNYRQDQLNLTYLLRSSDFSEHFNYDIYLADRLKCFVSDQLGVKPGSFTHWIGSLHIFQKDVKDVF